ncbi:receptor expression-enhancing protein 6 isoform X2 [Eurytemora carolleeae]|uniref:receptor expression-enhancing protein 6 isoform X2 n=1 Tax=Eurytemora carolleeae TaxID=1294199 RepID=UPI000C76DA43|nr:receptor expression-enhancing protein 6 isoform X2 [Eurytemora carolleeae]|eukprot:XP_023342566.1 receptor expression-enhancing protein 6-like isoform X2 [Eurytemora affinis]
MFKKLFGKQKKIKMAEGSTSVSQDRASSSELDENSSNHTENWSQETENSSKGPKTMFVQIKEYLDQVQVSEDHKLDRFIKGLCLVGGAWFLLGHGSSLLRVLIAFPFPAYRSLKAVLSPSKEDDISCLRYWIVLALFSCLEIVLDIFINLLPIQGLYMSLKLVLLLWFMAPIQLNGTDLVFEKIILPLYRENEPRLDELADLANLQASRLLSATRGLETGEEIMKKVF